jgi:hypothetical protein
MKPFFKQGEGRPAPKRAGAPRLEVLYESDSSSRGLAIGLQWKRIATSGGRLDATKMAREAGATHYIFSSQQLGMGVLPTGTDTDARLFPAALVAARQLHGASIVALKIAETDYWLAETHNGAPTSTDLLLTDVDDAVVLERVRQLIDKSGSVGQITVHTNITDHGLQGAKSYDLAELFNAVLGDGDKLQVLPAPGFSIPKPVMGVAATAILLLLGQQGYKEYENWNRARMAALNQIAEVDPDQAWVEAIEAWERGITAPTGTGLLAARESLDQVALDWEGWQLQLAQCTAGVPLANVRTWSCHAKYKREPAGVVNREMERKLPPGRTITWEPLGGMLVSWSVRVPAQTIKQAALPKPDFFNVEAASRLQILQPALGGEILFAFAPVVIPAPKKKDGTALPMNPHAAGLLASSLAIKAPLRSIDALIAADIPADWKQLSITYKPGLQARIDASAVMAEAKGDLYAKR